MNRTFKKFLAILTTLTMALSLFAVAPVMATGEEGEEVTPQLTVYEQIRKDTNIIKNGDLEAEEFNYKNSAETGYYSPLYTDQLAALPTYELSSKESYSKNNSILGIASGSGKWNHAIAIGTPTRYETTYIASVMILGTKINKDNFVNNSYAWSENQPRFVIALSGRNRTTNAVVNSAPDIVLGNVSYTADKTAYFRSQDVSSAVNSDEEGEKARKEDWQRMYSTMQVKTNVCDRLGFGVYMDVAAGGLKDSTDEPYKKLELYTDDYYLGELMVAEVKYTGATSAVVPNTGKTVVELSAEAYNQIENKVGLEDAEYAYELVGNPAGAYISGNQLVLTSDAQAGTIKLNVIAVPKFYGADSQSAEITKYRTKEVSITVTKQSDDDYYASLKADTNILTSYYPDAENVVVGTVPAWYQYATFVPPADRVATYTSSDKQAYNGSNSYLTIKPANTQNTDVYFPAKSSGLADVYGKTFVASVMVLGTQANAAACEANPELKANLKFGYLSSGYSSQLTTTGNEVLLNTMLDAKASEETTSADKVDKSAWKMLYASNKAPSAGYSYGAGVMVNGTGVEFYTDDYYIGELIVAKVDASATTKKAKVGEVSEIELKATAYNQLGNTEFFGEGSTFTWEKVSAPAGVDVVGDKLVIEEDAKAGKAVLNVTFVPTFTGAEAQLTSTNEQMIELVKNRTTTVVIDIIENPGFKYDASTGVVTAVVGDLAEDAKAYCALYKVLEGGAKKLMSVESQDVVAGGENVEFTAIAAPDYTYEIKCFMWYENNPMKNVINAVVYPQ